MPNQVTLVQTTDPLVIHVSSGGDLTAGGEQVDALVIETDVHPVWIDAVDPNGAWVFTPTATWGANPTGPGVCAELDWTDGEAFETHNFIIAPASNPTSTQTKPLPIKIKPISEGPGGLS